MKILFIADRWSNGGVPTVMQQLTDELSKEHNVVWLFYYTGKPNESQIKQYELHARFSGDPKAIIALRRLIQDIQPDVIHDHFGGIWSAGYLFTKWSKRAILHYHNEFEPIKESPDDKRTFKEGFFKKILLPRYQKIVCVSAYNARVISSYLKNTDKVTVIPNGVHIPDESLIKKKANSVFTIGFIGRLVYEKGVDTLLDAISVLKNSEPFEVLIAGDGDPKYIQSLKVKIQKNQLDNVRFLGRVEDKVSFFNAIDVMYFGSRQEPFGLTIIEAWAHQTPVIGFYPENGGGPFEIMPVHDENPGILLEKRDFNALAQLIKKIQADVELLELWQSRSLSKAHAFKMSAISRDWEEVYQRI